MITTNPNNLLDLVSNQERLDRSRLEFDRSTRRNVARAKSMELSRLDPDQLPILSPGLTGLELALRKQWERSKTRGFQATENSDQSSSTRRIIFKIEADQIRS